MTGVERQPPGPDFQHALSLQNPRWKIGAECNSETATSKLQYSGCAIKKQAADRRVSLKKSGVIGSRAF
jgi:hypothetical protein